MKDKYLRLLGVSTVLISALISASICFVMRQHIVSIDLIKILNAQAFYANKLIAKNPGDKNWVDITNDTNASIREKVRLVAGENTIVMVAPALIQGADDITERVLVALNLPSKPPNSVR